MDQRVDRSTVTIADEFAEKIRQSNRKDKIIRTAPLIVLAVLIAFFSITVGRGFASASNLQAILNQLAIPLIVAFGLTFVILIGSIDLSINGTVGMAGSIMACLVLNSEYPAMNMGVWGVLLAILASVVAGFLVGIIYVKLRILLFMVFFVFLYICRGIVMFFYQ